MDELEAKVRCLELAASVARSHANSDPEGIVELSTKFYNHVKAETVPAETPVRRVRSKKDNQADILG